MKSTLNQIIFRIRRFDARNVSLQKGPIVIRGRKEVPPPLIKYLFHNIEFDELLTILRLHLVSGRIRDANVRFQFYV